MTRERSENYDDKKELILRKAAALFAAKGYEITTMMDANFARARSTRRRVDRAMMNAEWPVLLKFMGKDAADGTRYLCVDEVQVLVRDRRLPQRVADRLGDAHSE